MRKRVMLIGGRSKARSLAISLINRGYQVTAVNKNYEDCIKLSEINKLTVINGDGSKPFILNEAEAAQCDIAIALTSRDEDNLIICEICKKRFNIKRTVSLVSDPKKTEFFYKMGIDSVVCAISAVTNIIEQQVFRDKMEDTMPMAEGRIQIAEIPVLENSILIDKKLWEVNLPKEVIIGCIVRGENTMIPRGDTKILCGDILLVISGNNIEIEEVKELAGR